jgi:hypothetical protein
VAWHVGEYTAIASIYEAFEDRWVAVDKIALSMKENQAASNCDLWI